MDITPAAPISVLGFDFGTRRIGVAVGNTLMRVARPVSTLEIRERDARFAAIAALIAQWHAGHLVVGIPVHADGVQHAMTWQARRFARQLGGRFALPVSEVDERHTSEIARAEAIGSGREGRAQRDAEAARIILQAWFDEQPAA